MFQNVEQLGTVRHRSPALGRVRHRDLYRQVRHAVHSLAVDPETHRVYTPEQVENGQPVARVIVYDAVVGK